MLSPTHYSHTRTFLHENCPFICHFGVILLFFFFCLYLFLSEFRVIIFYCPVRCQIPLIKPFLSDHNVDTSFYQVWTTDGACLMTHTWLNPTNLKQGFKNENCIFALLVNHELNILDKFSWLLLSSNSNKNNSVIFGISWKIPTFETCQSITFKCIQIKKNLGQE